MTQTQAYIETAKADKLWSYFSGNDFNLRFLKDYHFLDDAKYNHLIEVVKQNKDCVIKGDDVYLTQPALFDDVFDSAWIDQKTNVPVDSGCDEVLQMIIKMYLPLRFKRWELGLGIDTICYAKAEQMFSFVSKGLFDQRYEQETHEDMYFSVIAQTIKDLKTVPVKNKEQAKTNLKNADMLDTGLKKAMSGLAEDMHYSIQADLLNIILEAPEDKQRRLSHFFARSNMLFDLKKKPLSRAECQEKITQLIALMDKAVVLHPTARLQAKLPLFDRLPSLLHIAKQKRDFLFKNELISTIQQRG